METSTDPLKGKKTKASWVAGVFKIQSARAVCFVRKGPAMLLTSVARRLAKLARSSFSHADAMLSRKGTPIELRWLFSVLLAWPMLVVRVALIGIVLALWIMHAPGVFVRTTRTIANVESIPNKKRTPKKHRVESQLVDFSDVRTRIRELAR